MENEMIGKRIWCSNGNAVRIVRVDLDQKVHLDNGLATWAGYLVWLPIVSDGLRFTLGNEPVWATLKVGDHVTWGSNMNGDVLEVLAIKGEHAQVRRVVQGIYCVEVKLCDLKRKA